MPKKTTASDWMPQCSTPKPPRLPTLDDYDGNRQ